MGAGGVQKDLIETEEFSMRKVRRVLLAAMAALLCLSLAACGFISGEKAIDIALADLGIDRIAAARTDAVLDKSGSSPVYHVTIDRNAFQNLYVIDAKTGDIISSERVESNR